MVVDSRQRSVAYWYDLRVKIYRGETVDWMARQPVYKARRVKPAGKNPFGEVGAEGKLIIEGSLCPALFG